MVSALALMAFTAACGRSPQTTSPPAGQTSDLPDRTILPIAEPALPVITEMDARSAKAPARFEVRTPDNAPNVVVVLIDDIGFGSVSAFGGPVNTPTLERLAASGVKFNRFHTTALCSPTRTALLTGRNHHINNAGAIMELATAFPGNTGLGPVRPLADAVGLRQVLRVHRRRDESMGPSHLRRGRPRRASEGSELPFHDGHDQPGHRLGQVPEVVDAG
jgi:arylsulfatase